jgi:hypothetical protein|nr:hypothetical protein [Kofleriaceae bacterium]
MIRLAALALATVATIATTASAQTTEPMFIGTLTTGIVAIGGETTGYELATKDGGFEIDITDAALRARADKLDGKRIDVTGHFITRRGVERGDRTILVVSSLVAE